MDSTVPSLDELTHDLASLHDLATRGAYETLLSKTKHLSLLPTTKPHEQLTYTTYTIISLIKLRRSDEAAQHLNTLHDFDSTHHYKYQSYPQTYPNLTGSMVPFTLRWLYALIPFKLGNRQLGFDRLYTLLCFVRERRDLVKDLGQEVNFGQEVLHLGQEVNLGQEVLHLGQEVLHSGQEVNLGQEQRESCNEMWKRRESFVMNCLVGFHLGQKEFNVALDLINELIKLNPLDAVLVSKLGSVQMQYGDVDGAKKTFKRVEEMESRDENVVGRNKALVYVVEKDYVSAVREYDGCVERDGGDVVAVNNKALCLMYLRDLTDGIKVMESALERVPTAALDESLVGNLSSMYELAYVNHTDVKRTLITWIARVAPDDFDSSCIRI